MQINRTAAYVSLSHSLSSQGRELESFVVYDVLLVQILERVVALFNKVGVGLLPPSIWGCRMPSMCINIHPLGMGIINPTSQWNFITAFTTTKETRRRSFCRDGRRTRCDAAETEMTVSSPPLCKSNFDYYELKLRQGSIMCRLFF